MTFVREELRFIQNLYRIQHFVL